MYKCWKREIFAGKYIFADVTEYIFGPVMASSCLCDIYTNKSIISVNIGDFSFGGKGGIQENSLIQTLKVYRQIKYSSMQL